MTKERMLADGSRGRVSVKGETCRDEAENIRSEDARETQRPRVRKQVYKVLWKEQVVFLSAFSHYIWLS